MPKDPNLRQRRNRTSTRATLIDSAAKRVRTPKLPDRGPATAWHRLTEAWWRDIWRSPMAPEFLQSDVHGLYLLAELVDRFWCDPSVGLAMEIRLQRQCFGLTPIDRRRLQWEVARAEASDRKVAPRRPVAPGADPRRVLQVVS